MATDTTTKKADLSDILKQLNLTDPKQPLDLTTKKKLEDYLRQPNIDFGNSTDEELNNYNNALTFYKNADTGVNKEQNLITDISNFVRDLNNSNDPLNTKKLSDEQIQKVAEQSAHGLIGGTYKRNDINNMLDSFTGIRGYNGTISSRIQKTFESKVGEYKDTGTFDDTLSNQGKIVQDVLNTRGQVTSDQKLVQDYLANAPQQLNQSRTDFYTQQRESAQDYLKTNVIPKNLEPIERNPLTTDREVAQMISNLYGGVQASLDESESGQAMADINFFSDAAYKTKLQELVKSRGNLQAQLASDFNSARQTQQQGFQTAQSKLQNEFDVNLFKTQNEQALANYQRKLKAQQSDQEKANQSGLWSTIGGVAGSVGGAFIGSSFGNPIAGAVIGGQAGQAGSRIVGEVA